MIESRPDKDKLNWRDKNDERMDTSMEERTAEEAQQQQEDKVPTIRNATSFPAADKKRADREIHRLVLQNST